jgi:hypothetical protein
MQLQHHWFVRVLVTLQVRDNAGHQFFSVRRKHSHVVAGAVHDFLRIFPIVHGNLEPQGDAIAPAVLAIAHQVLPVG